MRPWLLIRRPSIAAKVDVHGVLFVVEEPKIHGVGSDSPSFTSGDRVGDSTEVLLYRRVIVKVRQLKIELFELRAQRQVATGVAAIVRQPDSAVGLGFERNRNENERRQV